MGGFVVVDAQHPPPWWAFFYSIVNNIIKRVAILSIMDKWRAQMKDMCCDLIDTCTDDELFVVWKVLRYHHIRSVKHE